MNKFLSLLALLLISTPAFATVTEINNGSMPGEEYHYITYNLTTEVYDNLLNLKVGSPPTLTLLSAQTYLSGNATALGSRLGSLEMTAANLKSAAFLDVPSSGDATTGQVVKGNDSRLTDARTPLNHSHVATDISDSTMVGRSVLTASSSAGARSAIGAGTSSFSGSYTDLTSLPSIYTQAQIDTALAEKVDVISGKGLSTNDYTTVEQAKLAAITGTNTGDQDLSGLVAKTTTVNSKALSSNVTLTASDVGAAAASHTHAAADIVSGTFADARVAQSNVTQHQAALSIATSQVTGTKTNTFISDFTTAARAAFTAGTNVTISSGVISVTIPTSAGTVANNSRTLNSCFRISTANDVDFHYGVDITAALVLGGGTATITSYTDSGCTTGGVALRDGTVSGVIAGGTTTVNLDGTLLAGKYAKITTTSAGVGATVAIRAVQQEYTHP